jgi:hypothetical protein
LLFVCIISKYIPSADSCRSRGASNRNCGELTTSHHRLQITFLTCTQLPQQSSPATPLTIATTQHKKQTPIIVLSLTHPPHYHHPPETHQRKHASFNLLPLLHPISPLTLLRTNFNHRFNHLSTKLRRHSHLQRPLFFPRPPNQLQQPRYASPMGLRRLILLHHLPIRSDFLAVAPLDRFEDD